MQNAIAQAITLTALEVGVGWLVRAIWREHVATRSPQR